MQCCSEAVTNVAGLMQRSVLTVLSVYILKEILAFFRISVYNKLIRFLFSASNAHMMQEVHCEFKIIGTSGLQILSG